MRNAKGWTCAAALGAAMLIGGCASGGAGESDEMASAGPTVGETAGNVAIQAGATEAMKKGGTAGSIGYGLQSHGSSLSRALFGRKKAKPKADAAQAATK